MDKIRTSSRGTWLVVGLIGFGLLLAGALYVYMALHRSPFRALTIALEGEFPNSAPHVEGGKRRLDQPGERILRVIMKVPENTDNARASQRMAEQIARFIADRDELRRFDVLEVHLYTLIPEDHVSRRSFHFTVAQAQSISHNGDASN